MHVYRMIGYSLFVSFIFYLSFRARVRRKVDLACSKTYLRKNCKGFMNRLLYTPLRERCQLGYLYTLHKWIVFAFSFVITLSLCLGWVAVLQVPLKLLMTLFIAASFAAAIIIPLHEQVAIYKRRFQWRIWGGSKSDSPGAQSFLWLSAVLEKVFLVLLFVQWNALAWPHIFLRAVYAQLF